MISGHTVPGRQLKQISSSPAQKQIDLYFERKCSNESGFAHGSTSGLSGSVPAMATLQVHKSRPERDSSILGVDLEQICKKRTKMIEDLIFLNIFRL